MTVAFSLFLAHSCIPFRPAYLSYPRSPLCRLHFIYYHYYSIYFSFSLYNSQQTLCCTIKFRSKTCNVAQGNKQRKFNPFNYMAILYVRHALEIAHSLKCVVFGYANLISHSLHSPESRSEKKSMFKWFLLVLSALCVSHSSLDSSLAPFCFPSFYASALVPPTIHGHKKSWIYFVWLGLVYFALFFHHLKSRTLTYLNQTMILHLYTHTVDGRSISDLYNNFLLGNQ